MTIRIGISGWRYAGWRGEFYPRGLPQRRELQYASRAVSTIEINGSHYALQTPDSYLAWHRDTPAGFVFSVKGPRYLTHMLRLREGRTVTALANFYASGVLALREKLGPFLWQFPPDFQFEPDRMDRFLALLPRDTVQAAALARRHDGRVASAWFGKVPRSPLRHAIEIRHPGFCTPAFPRLLRRHGVALVCSDAVAAWPYAEDVTADFIYMRLHGSQTLYGGSYDDASLATWESKIRAWAGGGEPDNAMRIGPAARKRKERDVFTYFDNDKKVEAPGDARRLAARLGLAVPDPLAWMPDERA